jgi:hypothetical protein
MPKIQFDHKKIKFYYAVLIKEAFEIKLFFYEEVISYWTTALTEDI